MDTIVLLEGEIGRENLSTQAKKRISNYNGIKDKVANIQKAFNNAKEEDKESYNEELSQANEYLDEYSEETELFLKDELADFTEKQKVIDAKLKAKKEEEDKQKKLIDDKLKEKKDKETEQAKIEADKQAKIEADKLKAGKDKEGGMGAGALIFGALALVVTLGAVNHFRNN